MSNTTRFSANALIFTALVLLCALSRATLCAVVIAPLNPKFVDYFGKKQVQTVERSFGHVPEPFVLPTPAKTYEILATSSLPAVYDLRTTGKLTSIRDQGSSGCCWAFAAYGSLESYLLPEETTDFSENNLKNTHGFDLDPNNGGNRSMAAAYLTRWSGPISETDDPYNASSTSSPTNLIPSKHVQKIIYIPNRTSALDNDAVKNAVMNHGAVYTTYYHSDSYYNSTNKSYCYPSSTSGNHAVCIVGWDDNYDRYKFSSVPSGNGAFIARNSWGTWWGESGYFYISYYDAVLAKVENAAFTAEESDNYNYTYGYDRLGWTANYDTGDSTTYISMVFNVTNPQILSAVAWYTASADTAYEITIYQNVTTSPTTGQQLVAATTTGIAADAGYDTIPLASKVSLATGVKYSVVVKLTRTTGTVTVPLEMPITGYSTGATANADETYYGTVNRRGIIQWYDGITMGANVSICLRAMTEPVPSPVLSVTPTGATGFFGPAGGVFSSTNTSYELTNTGTADMDWTASTSQTWISLAPSSGSLVPGATTTVAASINSNANSLATGSYSASLSFTNATNGNGNSSRTTSLMVCQLYSGVADLKSATNGGLVTIKDAVVTAIFGNCIYVQDANRPSGIRVDYLGTDLTLGDIVSFGGLLGYYMPDATNATERQIGGALVEKSN